MANILVKGKNKSVKGMRKTIHKGKNDAKGRGFALYRSFNRALTNKLRKLCKLYREHPNNDMLYNAIHRLDNDRGTYKPRHGR